MKLSLKKNGQKSFHFLSSVSLITQEGTEMTVEFTDQSYITESFIGTDSLKAWKKAQEKQTQLLIEKEKDARSRAKSPKKGQDGKKESKSKSPVQPHNPVESPRPNTKVDTQRDPPNTNPKVLKIKFQQIICVFCSNK